MQLDPVTPWALFFPIFVIGIVALILWIWAIVDIVKVPDEAMFRTGNRLIWVVIVVFTQVIGAIIYLAVGRPSAADRALRPPRDPNAPPPPPPGALP